MVEICDLPLDICSRNCFGLFSCRCVSSFRRIYSDIYYSVNIFQLCLHPGSTIIYLFFLNGRVELSAWIYFAMLRDCWIWHSVWPRYIAIDHCRHRYTAVDTLPAQNLDPVRVNMVTVRDTYCAMKYNEPCKYSLRNAYITPKTYWAI